MKFEKINWKSAYEWLEQKQEMLLKVYKKRDIETIRKIQCAILKDFRTTAVAVRRVSENQGSSTPGVDNKIVKTIKERNELAQQTHRTVCNPSKYKASPIKRILISKSDGTKRLLDIPTTLDRAIQAVYLEAIDPIVEEQSCLDSYGFRKFRSAQDAVLALRSKLIHPKASEWVLNVDIKKCFKRISHDFLLRHIPVHRKVDRNIMMKMLKAKIIKQGKLEMSYEGMPQGSVLSPVLSNIALNGLEEWVKKESILIHKKFYKKYKRNLNVHVVRYLDDFIVIGPSKKLLKKLKYKLIDFLKERGLEISKEKGSLVNLKENEVKFLDFIFKKRKFNYKLRTEIVWSKRKSKAAHKIIIRISKAKLIFFKKRVREIVRRNNNLSNLIINLNNYLQGWTNYFALTSDSAKQIRDLHRFIFNLCRIKVKKLYPKMGKKQMKRQFFPKHVFYQHGRYVKRAWVFSAPVKLERPSDNKAKVRLYNLDSIKAPGNPVITKGLNACCSSDKVKLQNKKPLLPLTSRLEKAVIQQKYVCPVCGQSLMNGEELELHHFPSIQELRVTHTLLKNVKLIALHKLCHRQLHRKQSDI